MCIESILQNHFGVKKVTFEKSDVIRDCESAFGEDCTVCESLTPSGKEAFAKLIGLLEDIECVFVEGHSTDPWAEQLKEIASKRWNIYDNVDIEANIPRFRNTSLDSIIQAHFGIKRVFLKTPKIYGYLLRGEPEPQYEYFTRAGGRAYGQLTELIYDLGELFGSDFHSNRIIDLMDSVSIRGH